MAETQKRTAQEETLEKGPFGLLIITVSHNTQVLIELRNNRKLLGRVKAFDRHMNMILKNVTEMWTEIPKGNKGKKAHASSKERFKINLQNFMILKTVLNIKIILTIMIYLFQFHPQENFKLIKQLTISQKCFQKEIL